ncbi:hypothetical protein [Vibrio sp.]|uniref:2'-5' RNA ligase family protein n=1 Tax=Vibrio sp. TaxID=678 RepID=UPI00311D6B08
MIQSIYDQMWTSFKLASERNDYKLDPYLLNLEKDNRRGISVLAYLKQGNRSVIGEIIHFQKRIRDIEPAQYFHPLDELHLTILSVISCISEFRLSDINTQDYAEIFHSALCSIPTIEIKYRGVSASPNCIVIQGFPVNDALQRFRNALRSNLSEAGLWATFDSRYNLVTAHSSIIRFKVPVHDGQKLLALCQEYRDYDFGSIILQDFELVFNNWYQNLAVTKSLACGSVSQ